MVTVRIWARLGVGLLLVATAGTAGAALPASASSVGSDGTAAPDTLTKRWQALVERGLTDSQIRTAADRVALSPAVRTFVARFEQLARQQLPTTPAATTPLVPAADAGEPQPLPRTGAHR